MTTILFSCYWYFTYKTFQSTGQDCFFYKIYVRILEFSFNALLF